MANQLHSSRFKLKPAPEGWGITAVFEGYQLVFTGSAERKRLRREAWQNLVAGFGFKTRTSKAEKFLSRIDLYALFDQPTKRAWNRACRKAISRNLPLNFEDIFLILLKQPEIQMLCGRLNTDPKAAEKFLKNYLLLHRPTPGPEIKELPFAAFDLALTLRHHKIDSLMLLGGLLAASPKDHVLGAIFSNMGLTLQKLEILAAWLLNLPVEFPPRSTAAAALYCCRQAEALEEHFGYTFDFPAIETAVQSSQDYYQDMRHHKALQYLVKAGLLAKSKGVKVITAKHMREAVI